MNKALDRLTQVVGVLLLKVDVVQGARHVDHEECARDEYHVGGRERVVVVVHGDGVNVEELVEQRLVVVRIRRHGRRVGVRLLLLLLLLLLQLQL